MRNFPPLTVIGAAQSSPMYEGQNMMMNHYRNHLLVDREASTADQRVRHIEVLSRSFPDLFAVTTADLERYLAGMRLRGMKPESRRSFQSSMHIFYAWATSVGHIDFDPSAALKSIRVPVTVPRIAPDDVIQLALITAELRDKTAILLARLACLRLSELTLLHTRMREHDQLRILGKGEKERMVTINDDLMQVLLEREAEVGPGPYFPGRWGGSLHPQSMNKIITRVTGCNPHSLRHAGATAAYRATKDLRGVQDMLGHASMATTQRYLHLDDDARRAVAAGTSFKSSPVNPNGWPTAPVTELRPRVAAGRDGMPHAA